MKEKLALIDTDILISILRRKEPAYKNSSEYLYRFGEFKISCITYYECLRGYKAIGATKKLQKFKELLKITEVIYIDKKILDKASEIYAFLREKGLLKGEFDLLIGTTALVNNYKVVINNEKHFEPLKDFFGLKIENWLN